MAIEKYYNPQIVNVPIKDCAEFLRLQKKAEDVRRSLDTWLEGFLKRSVQRLTDLWVAYDVEHNLESSTLRILLDNFEIAQIHLTRATGGFDIAKLLSALNRAVQRYEVVLSDPPSPPDSGVNFGGLTKLQKAQILPEGYFNKVNIVLENLKGIQKNLSDEFKKLQQAQVEAEQAAKSVWAEARDYIKVILDKEFKKAIEEIKKESIGEKDLSKDYSDMSHIEKFFWQMEKNNEIRVQGAVKSVHYERVWYQSDPVAKEAIGKLQAVYDAYRNDIENIHTLIQEAQRRKLLQYQPYKDLISRIEIIEKRIEDKSSFQDKTKNELKVKTLKELKALVENKDTSWVDICNFLSNTEKQRLIKQSTRSDEGCFASFFRNKPESKALLENILATIAKNETNDSQNSQNGNQDPAQKY